MLLVFIQGVRRREVDDVIVDNDSTRVAGDERRLGYGEMASVRLVCRAEDLRRRAGEVEAIRPG